MRRPHPERNGSSPEEPHDTHRPPTAAHENLIAVESTSILGRHDGVMDDDLLEMLEDPRPHQDSGAAPRDDDKGEMD